MKALFKKAYVGILIILSVIARLLVSTIIGMTILVLLAGKVYEKGETRYVGPLYHIIPGLSICEP